MKKYWRLLGSLILVGLLACRLDWRQIASAFAQLEVSYWLLALVLYLLTQGVSAVRWQRLGHALGLGGGWSDYLAHYFVGMFFNLVLPTSVGGDVVRAWYLGRKDVRARSVSEGMALADAAGSVLHVPSYPQVGRRTAAFLSVLADRVNGFAVLIALACLAALFSPIPLPGWIAGIVAGMGAACLLGLAALPLLPRLRRRFSTHPRMSSLLDGADLCLRDWRGLIWVTLLSMIVQVANVVLAWLIGEGLGLQVPPLYYGVLIPLVSMLTLLPISLNGMGLREFAMLKLLEPLSVSPASAVTLSLLVFAVYAVASLLGGLVYLLGRSPRFSLEASGHADPVGGDSDQGRMCEPPAAA